MKTEKIRSGYFIVNMGLSQKEVAFNGISKYSDGAVTYIFDDDKQPLKIKKEVNGQVFDVPKKFRDFSNTMYNIGLLPMTIELYKRYRAVDLPGNLADVTQKISAQELRDFVRILSSSEKDTVFYYLPRDKVIDFIRNNKSGQLAVGKIRKIDAKTTNKIKQHISSFNISHSNGGISGFHDVDCFDKIYDAAVEMKGKDTDVTDIMFPEKKDMKVYAKMLPFNPNKIILSVYNNGELYGYKLKTPEGFEVKDIFIRRQKTDKSGYKYYMSIPMTVQKGYEAPFEQVMSEMFKLKDEYGFFQLGAFNFRTIIIGSKKIKFSVDSNSNDKPNAISTIMDYDGLKYKGTIYRKYTPEGVKYSMRFRVDNPMENAAKMKNKSISEILKDFLPMECSDISENEVFKLMFMMVTDASDEDFQRIDKNTIKIKVDDKVELDDKLKMSLDREMYLLERENLSNGISIFKYSYGYGAGTKIVNATKTVVSSQIMQDVLKKISKENFNAAYKIDNSGKIFAYFSYKGIYFKLVLTNTTPTCFPMMKKDCENELGEQVEKIPAIS